MSNINASAFRVLDKNTWATGDICFGYWFRRLPSYHEWLSANTIIDSIRKRIHENFLKLVNKIRSFSFTILMASDSLGVLLSLSLIIAIVTRSRRNPCSKYFFCPPSLFYSLFDLNLLYRRHDLTNSLLFFSLLFLSNSLTTSSIIRFCKTSCAVAIHTLDIH